MSRLKIRSKKLLVGLGVGAVVGLFMAMLTIVRPEATEALERATYDVRARLAADPARANPNIVIVDIDEESLRTAADELSLSWPWPREAYAVAARWMSEAGASAVIFDFVFEDDGTYGISDTFNWAEALRDTKAVIGLSLSLSERVSVENLGRTAARLMRFADADKARRAAVLTLAWNTRVFLLPADGGWEIWIGGGLDEGPAYEDLERLLNDELFREVALAEGPETLPTMDDEPVVRALTDAELGHAMTAAKLYLEASGLQRADAGPTGRLERRPGINPPLALLAGSAFLCGNVSQGLDVDGIMRRIAMVSVSDGVILPSLSLAGAIRASGDRSVGFAGPDKVVLVGHEVPVDAEGRTLLRFHGGRNLYRHISIWDILQSDTLVNEGKDPKVDPASLKDAIVVVSASARALKDLKPTPLDASHLGAEVVANGIDNLLAGDFIRRAHALYNGFAAFILSLLMGAVALYIGFIYRSALAAAGVSLMIVVVVVAAYGAVGYVQYQAGLWIDLAIPALGASVAWAVAQLANTYIEGKDRRFIQDALGRYTSTVLVEEVMKNPQLLELGYGRERELSVFFSDIAGFTTISEGLEAERLVAMLNDYLTPLTELILESGGIVDKYIGDAIMAFWGAPIPMEDHARVACLTAIKMRDKINELAPVWKKEYGADVMARAGINSGPAVAGNTGSAHKFNYTVLGDTVNLASRLEGANKPYGTLLMISEATYRQAADAIEVRELDLLAVKGKDIPVRVFEVLCEKGKLPADRRASYDLFEEGLVLYRETKFTEAIERFEEVLRRIPDDGPSRTFIDRSRNALEDPPPEGWDGVWRMKTK